MKYLKLSCVLLFCLGFKTPFAQYHLVGSPAVINFPKTDYNAGTQNWDILQTEGGIMYFGNNKGLLEFDGTHWTTLSLPNRTIVRSLALDTMGKFYLGSQDDFGYLKFDERGKMEYASLVSLIPEEFRSFEDIWKVFPTEEGIFFCAQEAIFILRDGQIQVIRPPERFINFFFCRGRIFVQEKSLGLMAWKDNSFSPFHQEKLFEGINLMNILPFDEAQFLVISETNGLFIMDETGIQLWETPSSLFLKNNQVYCALLLNDGKYAFGTSNNGLLLMEKDGKPLLHLNKSNGLQNNTVLSIFQDHHQNLWLGLDNGIDYAEINAPFSLLRSETGVEGTGYAATLYQGKLYLGTNQGLYSMDWNPEKNPFDHLWFQQVAGAEGQVWTLKKADEQLLIGQHRGAFYLKDNRAVPFSNVNGAWKFMELKHHPGFAVEGIYSGLLLYALTPSASDPGRLNWQFIRRLDGFDESARVMEEDNEGNIWVSHAYKGIFKISLKENAQGIEKVSFYDSKNGLPTNISINVTKIRDELVFTTPAGIYSYDKHGDTFIKNQELNEIFGEDRNIKRLVEDQNGNIWFSIDEEFGVLKVESKGIFNTIDKRYFNHIQKELMEGYEYVYAMDTSHVFIATEKGFIHYDPNIEKNFKAPFKTLIRKVISTTNKDSVIAYGGLDGLSLETNRDFSFSPKVNDFKFNFSAPFYEQMHFLHYRYYLEGFENSWSEWGVQTEKEYTNLPHGNYRFIVEARNAYGQTSEQAIFPFTVQTPWYLTLLAKTIYLLSGLFLIFGLIRFYYRKVDQKTSVLKLEQAKTLEKKEAEFKLEVEKSEAEIIRLRNEKLRADISHKNSKLASAAMHLVQKGEILLKIKQDLNKILPKAEPDNRRKIKQLVRAIDEDIRLDNNWEQFELYFDQVHENYLKRLRENYPMLTPKDQKLCAYLRMNLSTKEIAPLMNISVRGVEISRYRLRKKLDIDSDTNLVDFLIKV